MNDSYNAFLFRLAKLPNGDRTALKRAVGVKLNDANTGAITAFYRCMPKEVPRWQEERWFLIACMRCLWPADMGSGEPIERVIRRLYDEGSLSDSSLHRAQDLLDTTWDEEGFLMSKMTRFVKLIRSKSNKAAIDFSSLLSDLIYWNKDNQSVQRDWARIIFTKSVSEE